MVRITQYSGKNWVKEEENAKYFDFQANAITQMSEIHMN